MNRVLLVGNLGAQVEGRTTSSGQMVASFRLATNETWKKNGEKQTRTEWHRCVAWGRTAELCKEHLTTGSQVLVEGKLQTRQWDDRNSVTRYTTEVVVDRVEFLNRSSKTEQLNTENESFVSDLDVPF